MPGRRVSMRDVAVAAGISPTSVSMILNGRHESFPPATRDRVYDAARRLGYRANRLARNLVRRHSDMIGVIIEYVDNPFFAGLAAYLNRRVAEHSFQALFEITELSASADVRARAADVLLDWNVDGLLHWWNEAYGLGVAALTSTPVVYFGSAAPNDIADSVILDDYGAAGMAARHLIELGHRRIAHLSRRTSIRSARTAALVDALRGANLPAPVVLECPNETAEEARAVVRELSSCAQRPTAIFCHNDVMAFGAFRGLRDAGVRVPHDVSLVGFDNAWAAEYLDPPLTTVLFPYHEIIDRSLAFLLNRIAGKANEPQRLVLPGELVVRGSTAPPAKR
ncbi:MAG: LacI family DNA-binding transcriptional regulator [Thermoguttaceae bacterium]